MTTNLRENGWSTSLKDNMCVFCNNFKYINKTIAEITNARSINSNVMNKINKYINKITYRQQH